MAQYELYLCNDRGRRLMPLTNLSSFAASLVINNTGAFSATLRPPATLATLQNYHYIERNIRKDWQVQVWFKTRGPWRLFAAYLVLDWGWGQSEDGGEVFSFGGYDINHLLTRRVVAAYAGSTHTFMTDYADDMMKAVVTDSLEDDALPVPTTGSRAWADLTVAANLSKGPSISKEFAWKQLLTLSGGGALEDIALPARQGGNPVYFRIVPNTISNSAVTWKFSTQTGQPLTDRTSGATQVVFDADKGTLVNWSLDYDYSEEVNAVYGLGPGTNETQNVRQVYDEPRTKGSYWGRCEGIAQASIQKIDAAIDAKANDVLSAGRPKVTLRGEPVSRQGQEFLRHWGWGDKVIARAKGKQFQALVWSVLVGQDEDGKVTESARLEFQE